MKASPVFPDIAQDGTDTAPPWTVEKASQWRAANPLLPVWWIVAGQVGVGLLAAVAAGAWSGKPSVGWSLGYGVFSVALPAAVFARALGRGRGAGGAGFLVWEFVKVGLTIILLAAAPRLVPALSWLALLAGMVVATKMYWVALAWPRRPRRTES